MSEEAKHTPEPWGLDTETRKKGDRTLVRLPTVNGLRGEYIAEAHYVREFHGKVTKPVAEANAARIVACVNACAGLSNEELERGVVGDLIAMLRRVRTESRDGVGLDRDLDVLLSRLPPTLPKELE